MQSDLKISVLIACYNEEKTIRRSIETLLAETRPVDEIVVVDDGSTDKTKQILQDFGNKIKPIFLSKNTGNKSYAQEEGLKHVTGDIFITTDADTLLDKNFTEEIEKAFADQKVQAAAGYVISIRHNWITRSRELDYVLGQNVYKSGQSHIGAIQVIPGAAGAFRTKTFKEHIRFDHDTLTEDLDFTYQLHEGGYKIIFVKSAIVYTEDPLTLGSYIKQERRWMGGGWQNVVKHYKTFFKKPALFLEIGLICLDGFLSIGLLIFLTVFHTSMLYLYVGAYFISAAAIGLYASIIRRNWKLFVVFPLYVAVMMFNLYVFIEQFLSEVVFRRHNLVWYKPERKALR